MQRFELKKYDPFPMRVGESRKLGQFVLTFDYGVVARHNVAHPGAPAVQLNTYYFSISDGTTTRYSPIAPGYWPPEFHKKDAVSFMEFLLKERRRYTIQNVMTAFQPGKVGWNGRPTDPETSSMLKYNYFGMDPLKRPNDPWNVELAKVLMADFKAWKKERRAFLKNNNIKNMNSHETDVEKVIKTRDMMEVMPLFDNLDDCIRAVQNARAKGENYTKQQIADVSEAINALKACSGLMRLKKHGKG